MYIDIERIEKYSLMDDDGDVDINESLYEEREEHNFRFYVVNIFGWTVGLLLFTISIIGILNLQFTSFYMLFCSLLFIPPVGKVLRKRMRKK